MVLMFQPQQLTLKINLREKRKRRKLKKSDDQCAETSYAEFVLHGTEKVARPRRVTNFLALHW